MESPFEVRIKRVYETPSRDDGFRVLVDRLWPRGLKKEEAKVDLWLKEIAPSNELRKWFSHDPSKWEEFRKRYREELKRNRETLERLIEIIKEKKKVTLLYSARSPKYNNAVVLLEVVEEMLEG